MTQKYYLIEKEVLDERIQELQRYINENEFGVEKERNELYLLKELQQSQEVEVLDMDSMKNESTYNTLDYLKKNNIKLIK